MSTAAGGTINVLERMLSSNENWSQRVADLSPNYFPENAQSHQPPVLWIGCSDARVPEALITDSPPGRIFVHRTIANQFPATDISALSVLDYAIDTLAVEHVIVVGHTNCNGVVTAYDNARSGEPPPTGTPLEKWLAPLTQRIIDMNIPVYVPRDEAIHFATKENVKMQFDNIRKQIAQKGKPTVSLRGWLYDLEKGLLKELLFWPK